MRVAAIVLAVLVIVFGLTIDTFLDLDNLSLVVQQSLVIGTLALGQLLVVRAAGIDLANAAIAVFATLLIAKLTIIGTSGAVALVVGIVAAVAISGVTGGLVTWLRLPPFIVTLGMLTIVTSVSQIYAQGQSFPVTDGTLGWLGTAKYLFGRVEVTYGMAVMLVMVVGLWFALRKSAWGKQDLPHQTILSVYLVAGLCYGIAAWQALGRVPSADPNAFQLGNLDSITAVLIGGASLAGGRGGVAGTVIGALIVAVLRSGLSQTGLNSLYQDLAVGALLIMAVAVDRFLREKQVTDQ
ncbi:ABC transporter permease [Actinophytocola sp.]|uniref:ABC transporter permease n=1 Tax=Actinophytocola sp. TaxID=1872138 RepID=UPI002ED0261F